MNMHPDADEATKAQLKRFELLLLDPSTRRNRERVDALLSSDFVEIGSSGRVWTRQATLDLLATENTYTPPQIEDLAVRFLGKGIALLTYRTLRNNRAGGQTITLRSSIWILDSGCWKICFHQGTLADQSGERPATYNS